MLGKSDSNPTLFAAAATKQVAPLADQMRPRRLAEVFGQRHIIAEGKFLAEAIANDRVGSLILWGPPGSGKTSLAHVIARTTRSKFVSFSAVLGGVAELRKLIEQARERLDYQALRTILFVDELHRFNKGQQDALLPHVERGTIALIGATTENPSFAINAAILSRCRVLRLRALDKSDLVALLNSALTDAHRGLGKKQLSASDEALLLIAARADGDARQALGLLEAAAEIANKRIDKEVLERLSTDQTLLYDRSGEEHYNLSSALIKSLRGSDPDAALYWAMRMLDAGDEPLFVLRRLAIFASEDVGNADPRALLVATSADQAFRRMGMPEGIFPIAQACLYLASCPKSNSTLKAISAARKLIKEHGALPVPMKLRNAPTKLMKDEGYGSDYAYAHDYQDHIVPGETYLPETLVGQTIYEPSDQGLERDIGARLARIRSLGKSD